MEPTLPPLHLKPTALQTLVIHLGAAQSGPLPPTHRAIHAQVLAWLRQGDPDISAAIHASQKSPLSVSGLMRHCQRDAKAGDGFYFRIGLLDGTLLQPLLNGIEQTEDTPFCLATFPFVLRTINLLPGTDPWIGASDYASLANPHRIANDLTLRFLSPTSFKLNAKQALQLFPLPEAVFGNLRHRWNAFAPEALKLPIVQWSGLTLDYDLKIQTLRMENLVERGAVGWVTYRFPDSEQARIATILAHFAFFAGVGRKTAMGMGQTILDKVK